MDPGRLTPLQVRILRVLAGLTPPWTLSGGAALAGVHTRHRATRDLDLFWQSQREFQAEPEAARRRLEAAGLEVAVVQRAEAFCRFTVSDAADSMTVDLVADPVPLAELPTEIDLDGAVIRVDTPHQILVNKLCALLGRSELRDLGDVDVLLGAGGDLPRALADAARQDRGFSPLTFAWVLEQFPVAKQAAVLAVGPEATARLEQVRTDLVARMRLLTRP